MMKWIVLHKKTVFTYSFATFAAIFAGFTFYSKFASHPVTDYLVAEGYFEKWVKSAESDSALLKKLDTLIAKHPELHAKYDALIAERLLMWQQADRAENYLNAALKRAQGSLLYYPEFSKTSLLISQGHLKEALDDALQLKEEMSEDPSLFAEGATVRWEGLLYAFNLVRIGMLEQRVGTLEGEHKAWDELLTFREKDPEAFATLQHHFREKNLTLFDYIAHRKTAIIPAV